MGRNSHILEHTEAQIYMLKVTPLRNGQGKSLTAKPKLFLLYYWALWVIFCFKFQNSNVTLLPYCPILISPQCSFIFLLFRWSLKLNLKTVPTCSLHISFCWWKVRKEIGFQLDIMAVLSSPSFTSHCCFCWNGCTDCINTTKPEDISLLFHLCSLP